MLVTTLAKPEKYHLHNLDESEYSNASSNAWRNCFADAAVAAAGTAIPMPSQTTLPSGPASLQMSALGGKIGPILDEKDSSRLSLSPRTPDNVSVAGPVPDTCAALLLASHAYRDGDFSKTIEICQQVRLKINDITETWPTVDLMNYVDLRFACGKIHR